MHPIEKLRRNRGESVTQFARNIGFSRSHVGDVEAGRERCGRSLAAWMIFAFKRELLDLGIEPTVETFTRARVRKRRCR